MTLELWRAPRSSDSIYPREYSSLATFEQLPVYADRNMSTPHPSSSHRLRTVHRMKYIHACCQDGCITTVCLAEVEDLLRYPPTRMHWRPFLVRDAGSTEGMRTRKCSPTLNTYRSRRRTSASRYGVTRHTVKLGEDAVEHFVECVKRRTKR